LLGFREEDPLLGQKLYEKAKTVVAGGVQLYSKDPDRFVPGEWPPYFREARGAEIWDESGKRWLDVGHHGIGACALGYRDPDVTEAVLRRVSMGSYSILNSREEPEVAELLCELHPWAKKVRFSRSGGETLSIAARIARATTHRSLIAISGYHGWHDFYLAANLGDTDALDGHLMGGLQPTGVPRELAGTATTFRLNDREAVAKIIKENGDRLAAVIMEPCRHRAPEPGFLEFVRDECHRVGALLVFDEVSVGWRLAKGGSHLHFGVEPDIACFAKALGSGHPMGAIIGTEAAMAGYYESFISSTYWTEGVGFAAAKATIEKMKRIDLPAHAAQMGAKFIALWQKNAAKHGLEIEIDGNIPNFPGFAFKHPEAGALGTLYRSLLLQHGVLGGNSVFVCTAHTDKELEEYDAAMGPVMAQLAEAIDAGDIKQRLAAGEARAGFSRLN
jgi:glutamate-1-semialdehyde 2,1-aminomutase